jgi:nucleotide-binding universal stress UspA family protein
MSGIVCAIRGRPASRSTINRSIQLAKDTNLKLHFLYVVNLDFLTHTTSSRIHNISEELEEMGEFIVLNAKAEAEKKGITTEGFVRNGQVGDEIIKFCKEIHADYMVLGKPQEQRNRNLFTTERINIFAKNIEDESGVKIIMTGAD